jgi:undecaprenyl-diphosphatase
VRDITSLGSVIVVCLLVAAVAGYLLVRRECSSAILLLASVFGGLALNDFLKMIFDRTRPALALPFMRVFTSSFPSGHAALSCVAYLTMAALVARASRTAALGFYAMAVAILLVLLVGLSRVYLGVHYPSDVLAGWCVGLAWVLMCWRVAEEIARRRSGNGRQSQ